MINVAQQIMGVSDMYQYLPAILKVAIIDAALDCWSELGGSSAYP